LVPPFIGVAVNVTEVPSQIGLAEGDTETLTGRIGLTVMVIVLEVAGLLVAQSKLDIRIQLTTSPFIGK